MRLETAPSNPRASSNTVSSAPTNKVSEPSAAFAGNPVTGQSRYRNPRPATCPANSITHSYDNVEHSMANAPLGNAADRTPEDPSHSAREAASSATMQKTASTPWQASAGLKASRAPRATSAEALEEVRL